MTEKKPFYKKWWLWSIIAIIVVAIIVPEEDDTDNQESNEAEKVNAEEKPEETEEAKTEHDEEFQFTEFLIDGITTELNGDELELRFYWTNESGEDDLWFERVGWVDVSQDGELLEEVSGAYDSGGDALREAELGVRLPVKLIYEIQNDEPIDINFGPTLEADQNRYKITVQ